VRRITSFDTFSWFVLISANSGDHTLLAQMWQSQLRSVGLKDSEVIAQEGG
jgi:hypothetical protein